MRRDSSVMLRSIGLSAARADARKQRSPPECSGRRWRARRGTVGACAHVSVERYGREDKERMYGVVAARGTTLTPRPAATIAQAASKLVT